MGKIKFILAVLFLSLLSANLHSRTREEVIKDAVVYSTFNWTVGGNNILDEEKYLINGSSEPGKDGVDDRMGLVKDADRNGVIDINDITDLNKARWPFYDGKVVGGEAYAWGYAHHLTPEMKNPNSTYPYKSFQEYLNEGRIAGAREDELDRVGVNIGDFGNNDDFTGLDCSGFIVRAWGVKEYHWGTGQLPDNSLYVSTGMVKAGDVFNRVGKHTLLIDKLYQSSASVVHAVPSNFTAGEKVQRVTTETIKISAASGSSIKLWDQTYNNWYDYKILSAFPQITWIKNGDITDSVKVLIESATPISTSTIRFVVDEGSISSVTITTDKLYIPQSKITNDGKTVEVEYNMATDLRISTGPHSVRAYAANSINLESDEPVNFNLTRIAPVITWFESWKGEFETGVVYGEVAQSTKPWLHSTSGSFILVGTPELKSFKIYADDTFSNVLYDEVFTSTTYAKTDKDALKEVPDGFDRVAIAEDSLGRKTTMYFHLDRTGITVDVNSAVINVAGDGFSVDVAGIVIDTMSGIGIALATAPGTSELPPDFYYNGPTDLQGPTSYQFSLTGFTESSKLAAMDRASWAGAYNLVAFSAMTTIPAGGICEYSHYASKLESASLSVTGYYSPEPRWLSAITGPTGMTVELYAGSEVAENPDFSVTLNFTPVTKQKLLTADAVGTVSGSFNSLIASASAYLVSDGNTNSGTGIYCTQWSATPGICETSEERTYGPGVFFYQAEGSVNAKVFNVGGSEEWYKDLGGLGTAIASMDYINVFVNEPGWPFSIDIGRKKPNLLNLPVGLKPVYDYVYEIIANGSYGGPVTLMMNYLEENFTDLQKGNMTIYQGDANYNFSALTTERFAGYVKSILPHFSPYALVTVVDDITPPNPSLVSDDYSYSSGGSVYVSTGAYFRVTAQDYAVKGDISGAATRYYLIDALPDAACLATPYDPQAGKGTCANPVYDDIFTLSEGEHTVYYTAEDNFGNKALWQWLDFRADGTAPATDLLVNAVVQTGGNISATAEDFISLASEDPVSSNVSSGLDKIYYTTNTLSGGEFYGEGLDLSLFQTYETSFQLGIGTYTLSWLAVDKVGNQEQLKTAYFVVTSTIDLTPPVTSLEVLGSVLPSGATGYIQTTDFITLNSTDPYVEGFFTSGVQGIFHLIDIDPDTCLADPTFTGPAGTCDNPLYAGLFTLPAGPHFVYYNSADNAGNEDMPRIAYFSVSEPAPGIIASDITPSSGPIGTPFTINGSSFGTYLGANTKVLFGDTTAPLTLWTDTQIKGTVPGSISIGSYSVVVERIEGNTTTRSNTLSFELTAPYITGFTPTTGPIGTPFTITGESFGNYTGATTRILIGGATCPLTLWSDTKIQGTVPGTLSPGEYPVLLERELNGSIQTDTGPIFTITSPAITSVTPSSGPIGMPFTILGENFGNYLGSLTKVLIGDTTCPLTLWTDTKIQGTVPGTLTPGEYSFSVVREVNDGIQTASVPNFTVLPVIADSISPSSGPIGLPFTILGSSFGNYLGSLTNVLFGDTTAPLTLWTDTKIQGTVPGSLSGGAYSVVVERKTSDGAVRTTALSFQVLSISVTSMTPTAGPVGMPFTIWGNNFGNYLGSTTKVLIGGTTCPLTLWSDSKIQGTVPNIAAGNYQLIVEREISGSVVSSLPLDFAVTYPAVTDFSPSSGPIGIPFTINGSSFGNYLGAPTRVLIGGTTCPLTLWSDTQIKGTIPGTLPPGDYSISVIREVNGGLVQVLISTFTLTYPAVYSVTPSSGPIGMPFTIMGSSFGNYLGTPTKVLIGGTTCPLTLWIDTKIQGTVPNLPAGEYSFVVERTVNSGTQSVSGQNFIVTTPHIDGIDPSTQAVSGAFTLIGTSFGNYTGATTKVLVNGATSYLTLWTDTKIQGKLPYFLTGEYPVVVQRDLNGGLSESNTVYISVVEPAISTMTPSSGKAGISFTIDGAGFGTYEGVNTKLWIGTMTASLTLWIDSQIKGTIPTLNNGAYLVKAERLSWTGNSAYSNALEFTVTEGIGTLGLNRGIPLTVEFKLGEVFVYPNPAKNGKIPTFHIETGFADRVKIKIYNVAGEAVKEQTLTGGPNKSNPAYAYEWGWEGYIPSGVYYYTVETEKAGKKLKAKGKFAVVR